MYTCIHYLHIHGREKILDFHLTLLSYFQLTLMFTVTQKYIFFVSGLRNLEVSTEKVTSIFASDVGI